MKSIFIENIKNFGTLYKNDRIFPLSNIINLEEEKIILSWFEIKNLKFHLLFDSKKDGDSILTFYQKCKNKSPTLLFFKTTKGNRFGGFTTQFGNLMVQKEIKKVLFFH